IPVISKLSTTWNSSRPSIKNFSAPHIHLRLWLFRCIRSGAFMLHRAPLGNQPPLLIPKPISKYEPHWFPAACALQESNPVIKYTTHTVTDCSPVAWAPITVQNVSAVRSSQCPAATPTNRCKCSPISNQKSSCAPPHIYWP